MKFETRKRNSPIAKLIKNYTDKNSGKVSDSRSEIRQRFDYLDWKDQKKIILAFLDSCRSDRQWIYKKLYENWDKSFEPKVREIWETYREPMCAWSVIRFFPTDYVLGNIESFSGDRDYYFICLRFADDHSFVIDESKLRPEDFLSVLFHSGRKINDDKALDILFSIVRNFCTGLPNGCIHDRIEDHNNGNDIITPSNLHSIKLAKYYLRESNLKAIYSFDRWNQLLYDTIAQSSEYQELLVSGKNDYSARMQLEFIAKKYAYDSLDDKYKSPSDVMPTVDECDLSLEYETSEGLIDYQTDDIFNQQIIDTEDIPRHPNVNTQEIIESFEKSNPDFKKLYEDFGLDENIEEGYKSDDLGMH